MFCLLIYYHDLEGKLNNSNDELTNAACVGGSWQAETTANLTDLSDSDIVLNMFIVCRHVIISKCDVSYWFYSYLKPVFSTFNLQVRTTGGTQIVNAT